ncbi:glycine/betaine ABC transporter ATP-binding protein [Bacillus sp. MKU004]|uniref:ABC transporter ATP-binding protein n=1 Tax=[Bacillus] enclensis TaxID=1402860 RepID=UPI0007E31CA4|nr:ATP-binding cassette domain-containing protein [[Bacillus] enclensis]MBH9965123.1 ATP-binding cassette domain-containing protein [[Bacillus] enclensis]OAT82538.1 glycine/betaine ABC transporter ATP-binding protein [Bacillus sp. MKU004]
MIEFKNVRKVYEDGTEAIKGIDLLIPEGKLVALIGPSGCGKTTTMKMINKLIGLTSGTITINGRDISEEDEVELRRNIGYVIQRIGLLPHMTIEENISLIPRLKGWKKEKYENRVDELMNLVGLEPETYRKRYPLELSGGQQQRVGVIRALAAEPPIILMDEPFSALDPISREQLQDELKHIQNSIHKTIVFVTHDIDEALKIADDIAVMRDGRIEQIASPGELVSSPANEFVRSFIGEHRLDEGKKEMSVLDIMSEDPIILEYDESEFESIPHDATIAEAAALYVSKEPPILVVTKEGRRIGSVSRSNILEAVASKQRREAQSQ